MPGDCLIAANGDYGAITIGAKGTAEAPIVLRAATRGMAVFTGRVTLTGRRIRGDRRASTTPAPPA